MSYVRVIPRDLFNEADLLKCLGHLCIMLETTRSNAKFDVEDAPVFDIRQDESDGSIHVANLPFSVDGRSVHLSRPLNSRSPWPLYLSRPDEPDFEPIRVFEQTGFFSDAMQELIKAKT
jgi:hypothetical protein